MNEDWLSNWKKGFVPFTVGNQILISPQWHLKDLTAKQIGTRKILVIEPGMAFGTGLHATTAYCLKAIERFPVGTDVLDVGTGSGILAIASALLFNDTQITGVDIDVNAISVARSNACLNKVDSRIQFIEGSTEVLDNLAFDSILSNLTCEDILALLPEYLRLLRPQGIIICAGILKEKLILLEKAIDSYPLNIVDSKFDETWAGAVLKRIPVVIK